MSSVGFAYDSTGHTYGCAAGGDINSTDADRFSLMTDRWGVSGEATGGSYAGTNALRLEAIAQYGDAASQNQTTLNFDKTRVKSPSIATSRGTNSTNVYMAYFDNLNGEIRFRYGNLADTQTTKKNFGKFNDAYRNNAVNNANNLSNGKYNTTYVQVIANDAGAALGYAGEYVSIDVDKNGYVVLVWYDSENGNLMYSYNTTPTTERSGKNSTGWNNATTVIRNAGEYCQIATDKNGGIHIVAYDGNSGDLIYAYASAYNAAFKTCTVDSYAIVGQNITLDVALNASGVAVPYIGYYGLSSAKPKYAYLADPTTFYAGTQATQSTTLNGATDEAYTGIWEVTIVPTSSKVPQDRINVGVWKDSSTGKRKASNTGQ